MTSRLKRNCKKCNKRANLAFDPKKMLCPECLVEWRDNVIKEHRAGKMTFQDAYESILKRCRINEDELLDLVFPPLGKDDFQNDNMAVNLNFDMDVVKKMEELEDE